MSLNYVRSLETPDKGKQILVKLTRLKALASLQVTYNY